MTTLAKLASGFNCGTCGTYSKFPAYVFSHWDQLLTHTCEKCGAKHEMVRGNVELIQAGSMGASDAGDIEVNSKL